ncbi:hypothetical protein ACOQFV_06195 [Nocardiopsis changdeensis]|uniref:DoxX family protein n=1 Tax=Nocardiopsis changdeensis TaxID=2831969 RepID=A0ABX8BMH8_9ACTN|nr:MULTISPECIES: hypothetical protein [Nocardiopsis]QUX23447.1 hypothetical protein KGD84_03435 [Nocardiopsis changdeensis]QYX39391.1 hypothetical protein K1J57_12890 [Nocardiopsis sp. MT53]
MDRPLSALDGLHARVRGIRALSHFTWCVRILLALGFLPSGYRKVVDEPFTMEESLGEVYVMFTALHQDFGALYVFIGLCQVGAALLLLVPRTAALGAAVYLPIITGIVVITVSLDFGLGTPLITSLMLLGAVYLLCWDWHRVRPILGPPRPAAAEAGSRV